MIMITKLGKKKYTEHTKERSDAPTNEPISER